MEESSNASSNEGRRDATAQLPAAAAQADFGGVLVLVPDVSSAAQAKRPRLTISDLGKYGCLAVLRRQPENLLYLMLQYLIALYLALRIMAHILPASVVNRLRMLSMDNQQNQQNNATNNPRPSPAPDARTGTDASYQPSAPDVEVVRNMLATARKLGSNIVDAVLDLAEYKPQPYQPSPVDIVVVRLMLVRAQKIPPDVADFILDLAEYWAHSSNYIDYREEHQDVLRVSGTSPGENRFLLRSYPVGLTGIYENKELAEELAYCTNESKPQPLGRAREPEYFAKLADYPAPVLASPVRKIVFTIRSRDQGWSSSRDRTDYGDSWTWFDAGLERFDADQTCDPQCTYDVRYKTRSSTAPSLPVCALRPIQPQIEPQEEAEKGYQYTFPMSPEDKWTIQRNKKLKRNMTDHVVTWSFSDSIDPESEAAQRLDDNGRGRATGDGSFVRGLKLGDVVTVWAKARFPGWVNHIERVQVDVYWAV
ncbi:hypothetical protein HJFPF1_05616 [Paramyrothecium foliicola]|nr:hypothetical protein HJFPF1_05616 [Paramyrothecium foliicola]